jgi:predicted DNA-binding transcriptional regulator AlpA
MAANGSRWRFALAVFYWRKDMADPQAGIDYVRSRKEAAKILGVSVRTLYRMENRGEAPPRVKITERIIGYRDSAINAFLNSRTTAA